MNSLTNRQRVLVFALGFFIGCIALSMIHRNKRLAREENQPVDEGVPGVIRFYGENGFPLDGPFILETTQVEKLDESLSRRVVLIGSKDRLEMYRIEELMTGTLEVDAVVERWVVTDPREVRVILSEGTVPAEVIPQARALGYTFRRPDTELGGYLVEIPRQDQVNGVEDAERELSAIEGIDSVHPIVLSSGERAELEPDSDSP